MVIFDVSTLNKYRMSWQTGQNNAPKHTATVQELKMLKNDALPFCSNSAILLRDLPFCKRPNNSATNTVGEHLKPNRA